MTPGRILTSHCNYDATPICNDKLIAMQIHSLVCDDTNNTLYDRPSVRHLPIKQAQCLLTAEASSRTFRGAAMTSPSRYPEDVLSTEDIWRYSITIWLRDKAAVRPQLQNALEARYDALQALVAIASGLAVLEDRVKAAKGATTEAYCNIQQARLKDLMKGVTTKAHDKTPTKTFSLEDFLVFSPGV